MTKKYELTDRTTVLGGRTLHRIRALKDIPEKGVEKGDYGGYIESEDNLFIYGTAWVADSAAVYGKAEVDGSATVSDNAKVYGSARLFDRAKVYGRARVSGSSRIFGNARVFGDAWVYGSACVLSGSVVCEYHTVGSGCIRGMNLRDTEDSLMAQLGVAPIDGEVVLYKRVKKEKDGVYRSNYDSDFKYRDGEVAVVDDPDMSNASCSSGIHCGNMLRWKVGDTWIAVRVKVDDIITVQKAKARCKKVKVIGEV